MERSYDAYIKHNASKSVMSHMQTPATLFGLAVLFYVLAGLMGVVGFETIANAFNVVVFLVLGVFAAWVYCKVSGGHAEVGAKIDSMAAIVYNVSSSSSFLFASKHNHSIHEKKNYQATRYSITPITAGHLSAVHNNIQFLCYQNKQLSTIINKT